MSVNKDISVASQLDHIGFIGLGAMGKPMVTNLAKALDAAQSPAKIHIYDVVAAPIAELCSSFPDRIAECMNPLDVAKRSTVVFTMLPEGSHVKSVYLDSSTGIINALSPQLPSSSSKLLIDSSTIDTATHLFIKSRLADASPSTPFYDAPVSGGVLGAVKGTIAFFVGCSPQDQSFARLQGLLSPMGDKIIPCGGPSLGLAAKLANNYLSGTITIACAEAMDMGMRAGLDPGVLQYVFSAGTAQNRICDEFNPVPGVCPNAPPSHGYKGGFRVQLMRKDIGLAMDMARRVGSRNVLGVSSLGVYAAASEAGDCKDLDSRVVYRYLGGKEN
ncbi:6-phosphogluconate dehydrogenase [Cladorrhinum samala]|uniref:3-hydroxyisobutyrate dehydrogenase n=1 Tax=Cladorrhinum samala TaxID=585594 RepID=A0AAV9HRN6_9PEZI|nr:6-phosphogluconate dehydrogenase [Cladorrhinum samala]